MRATGDDTLVVESFGFNDKTWLNARGLQHTEALRMTERYTRRDVGSLTIDVTFTDPGAFQQPLRLAVDMTLAADTELLGRVARREVTTGRAPSRTCSVLRWRCHRTS